MGEVVKENRTQQLVVYLLLITIFGTLLLPPFQITPSLPSFELSDITFPLLAIGALVFLRPEIHHFITRHRALTLGFSGFIGITIISILWNNRLTEIRDWFEVLKYIKFFFFLIITVICFSVDSLRRLLSVTFIALFLFNLLHYFNVFQFNTIIEPFYSPAHHLDFFGLNSLGEPATKRALGTLGNPNTNGLLFLLFTIVFLPRQKRIQQKEVLLLFLAILGLFMCQSRTGTLAFGLVLISYFMTMKSHWQTILALMAMSVVSFFLLHLSGNFYLDTLGNAEVLQRTSRGRIEQWIKIIASMPGYWFLGHAPNKHYFEANAIYSESEYFLILFRYGGVGLMAFLLFWWIWLRNLVIQHASPYKPALFIFACYVVGAFTNNPLQSPKIALLLGVVMALAILEKHERRDTAA